MFPGRLVSLGHSADLHPTEARPKTKFVGIVEAVTHMSMTKISLPVGAHGVSQVDPARWAGLGNGAPLALGLPMVDGVGRHETGGPKGPAIPQPGPAGRVRVVETPCGLKGRDSFGVHWDLGLGNWRHSAEMPLRHA